MNKCHSGLNNEGQQRYRSTSRNADHDHDSKRWQQFHFSYNQCLHIGYGAISAGIFIIGFYNRERIKNGLNISTNLFQNCNLEANTKSYIGSAASTVQAFKPPERSDLPTVSLEEVRKHGKDAQRIWVTFKQGVYDITDFISGHPGGDKILLAAGGSIEPFWLIYAQHKTEEVMEILEELRIANLDEKDLLSSQQKMSDEDDPFRSDPIRHPALLINSLKPFNAEIPPSLLVDSFITPNQLFFVRNHMPVPQIDEAKHRVNVSGLGIKKDISLDVDDLRNKYEPVKLTSTIQCAGNRRNDMNAFKKVQGLMWAGTAISNAEWTGCRLRDILLDAGLKPDDKHIQHVQFEGADVDSTGNRYGASIPFEKAMNPEVIIAYEMNGQPLPQDHGYPVRLIVPGIVGARQVKWLTSIKTSEEESESHWQRRDYKAFPSSVQIGDPLPFDSTPPIQEYPVQSAICVPAPNSKIPTGTKTINVSGYAWSGGGRGIIRVEVSPDGGKSWECAELQQCPDQDLEHMWAWTLWNIELPISEEMSAKEGQLELMCKATDRAYNTQPETSKGIWNVRGLLYNAWHRVPLLLERKTG